MRLFWASAGKASTALEAAKRLMMSRRFMVVSNEVAGRFGRVHAPRMGAVARGLVDHISDP
jgi:hypothetical protein